jgi:hypothetical protein
MNWRIDRVKSWIKWSGVSVLIASTSTMVWTSYDLNRRLRKELTNDFKNRAEFIYIPRDFTREPVRDILNEFFEEETKIYSFLYNIKRSLTFTKVRYFFFKDEIFFLTQFLFCALKFYLFCLSLYF